MPGREYVVHPEGELDIATVEPLREEWLRAVEREQPALFVVDLTQVTYLDSTALSVVVMVTRRQREHGGDVIVINAHPRLARIFQLTGLGAFLDIDRHPDHQVRAAARTTVTGRTSEPTVTRLRPPPPSSGRAAT
jgi:anti-sigma B factor antagonist